MSFGFAIGDFITVGKLAWTLYRECYQIARGSPQEFSLLVNELSTLSNSLTILQEEVKDPESTLRRAGDDRVRMVNEMVAGIEETLKRLRKVASKYDILGSGSKTKQIWVKLKWSTEFSSIDRLRNKLIYHNTVINLLLTSVGNSSLQRIESSNAALASDVQAIKNYIASNQAVGGSKVPALSALNDDPMSTTLSASLMMSAEASQPWSTIGFDQWIGTGRWWLLRAQVVLRTITESEQSVAPAAYAALIKATWILIDVIPCHPQFPFISASKSSELKSLSAEVRNEFSRIIALAMVVPALGELSSQHLRLWESVPLKAPILRPYKFSQNLVALRGDGGEQVLFRRFAFYKPDSSTSSPCILLFLVHESAKAARLIAQDQYDGIVRVITFPDLRFLKNVNRGKDGKSVMVGKDKFVLGHVQEAQVLCNMIEATTFYITGRRVNHASLEDLKAYMLLTAVKNRQEQAAAQIRQEFCKTDDIEKSDQKGSLTELAVSIAAQWIKGRLPRVDRSDDGCKRDADSDISLLMWAVTHKYTTLTEFLLSENPVFRSQIEYDNVLYLSAADGSESALRSLLSHASSVRANLSYLLVRVLPTGRESVVALVVDAGADLDDEDWRATHHALESPLSEPVIHAILAMAYATESQSEFNLREAADRGHEGAIVLLSFAETMKSLDSPVYSSHSMPNYGNFMQVVAALARVPGFGPAFNLTLSTAKRRKTKIWVKVDICPWLVVNIYLDSYQAYIEDVPEGISEYHKKAIKVEGSCEFLITVVHQEESLIFSAGTDLILTDPYYDYVRFRYNSYDKEIELRNSRNRSVKLPID